MVKYLFKSLIARNILRNKELLIRGKIRLYLRRITRRPLPRWTMMNNMITSCYKFFGSQNSRFLKLRFLKNNFHNQIKKYLTNLKEKRKKNILWLNQLILLNHTYSCMHKAIPKGSCSDSMRFSPTNVFLTPIELN